MRVSDGSLSMQAGSGDWRGSTKAFTAPLVDLYMLAVLLADLRGVIPDETRRAFVRTCAWCRTWRAGC